MSAKPASIALALQGGGSHGAFTWGALDRILEDVDAGKLDIAAVSGTSAGAFNAALTVSGLMLGGPGLARQKLAGFWDAVARRGALSGNGVFFGEPGPFGFNLDFSPLVIALEAAGLVVSPYTNPFYSDALAPIAAEFLPRDELLVLNTGPGPRLFITATDVASNARVIFSQPEISAESLRASACLPTDFKAVTIAGVPFWDGGFLGNPALTPLLDHADDLLLVLVNPFNRSDMPPRLPPAIADRLNEITFNASVVLEVNAIEAINSLLRELADLGVTYAGRYRPIRLHAIRNDAFAATLGSASKNSVSRDFLAALRAAGYEAADAWLREHAADLGQRSSLDVKTELLGMLKKPAPKGQVQIRQ